MGSEAFHLDPSRIQNPLSNLLLTLPIREVKLSFELLLKYYRLIIWFVLVNYFLTYALMLVSIDTYQYIEGGKACSPRSSVTEQNTLRSVAETS